MPALIITGFADLTGPSVPPPDVAVLRKPFTRLALLEAVSRIVDRNVRAPAGEAGPVPAGPASGAAGEHAAAGAVGTG
jgi:hypothetical protein